MNATSTGVCLSALTCSPSWTYTNKSYNKNDAMIHH